MQRRWQFNQPKFRSTSTKSTWQAILRRKLTTVSVYCFSIGLLMSDAGFAVCEHAEKNSYPVITSILSINPLDVELFLQNSYRRQINFWHATARRRINFRQTSSWRRIIFRV